MTKVSLFRNLFFLFTCLVITPYLSAQPDSIPDIINGGKILDLEEDDRIVVANEDCIVAFTARVHTVNFQQALSANSDYPDMYLSFSVNEVPSTPIFVDKFDFSPNSFSSYWTWSQQIETPVLSYCQEDENVIYVKLELLALENGEFFPYPVDRFGTSGDIFSCNIFDETCEVCIPTTGDCDPPYNKEVVIQEEYFIDCKNCDPSIESPGRQSEEDANKSRITNVFEQVHINPNPFKNFLQLSHLSTPEADISLRVFSATGQVVFTGPFTTFISTENWSPGIYFVEIMTNGERQTQRLLKIE